VVIVVSRENFKNVVDRYFFTVAFRLQYFILCDCDTNVQYFTSFDFLFVKSINHKNELSYVFVLSYSPEGQVTINITCN